MHHELDYGNDEERKKGVEDPPSATLLADACHDQAEHLARFPPDSDFGGGSGRFNPPIRSWLGTQGHPEHNEPEFLRRGAAAKAWLG